MSILLKGLELENGLSLSLKSDDTREYSLRVRVESTLHPAQTSVLVATEAALRTGSYFLGAPCPFRSEAGCTAISLGPWKRLDGVVPKWKTTAAVTFSTKPNQKNPNENKDPTTQPPNITFDIQPYSSAAMEDINGDPPTNSADDLIPRERKRAKVVIRIQKNFRMYDWSFLKEAPIGYLYSRNAAAWDPRGPYSNLVGPTRVGAGKGLLTKLNVVTAYENSHAYVKVNADVETDEDMHKDIFLDQGFFELLVAGVPDFGSRQIMASDGSGFASSPQLLDGAGQKLASGLPPQERQFQYYPTLDWAGLLLP